MNVTVIGCGRWGSFIAYYLDKIGKNVTLYGRSSSKDFLGFKESRTNGKEVDDNDMIRIIQKTIKELGYEPGLQKEAEYFAIKMPVFSFEKIKNADTSLGPEMKSTGEVLGVSKKFENAVLKAFIGSGANVSKKGAILITVRDKDKAEVVPIAERFKAKGFDIYATSGTAKYLKENGVDSIVIEKLWEGRNSIIDLIELGKTSGGLDDMKISCKSKKYNCFYKRLV